MIQHGQVFPLKTARGQSRWAHRYRLGGRDSRRVQHGGFASEQAAAEALERALEQLRREQGLTEAPTLAELAELYLAQHDGEPETTEKLRWLLAKSVRVSSRLRPVVTSTCTTSAIVTGARRSSRSGSSRSGGSATCDTRSRPSRCAPASRPSTSPATWAQAT